MKSVALSKSSNRLITCGQDRNILMYRLDQIDSRPPEEFEGPEVGSRHVVYGETERVIYVASEDGGLTVTDLRTGDYMPLSSNAGCAIVLVFCLQDPWCRVTRSQTL